MACVRTFCRRLSGRGEAAALNPHGGPTGTEARMSPEEAAAEALPQLEQLLQQYEQLQPCLVDALASQGPLSRCSVNRFHRQLTNMVQKLQGIADAQPRLVHEVSVNANVNVTGTWETKRVVLRPEGFEIRDMDGLGHALEHRWVDVSNLGGLEGSHGSTPTSTVRRVVRWLRGSTDSNEGSGSSLHRTEIQLASSQQLRFYFAAPSAPLLMQHYWEASRKNQSEEVLPPGPEERLQPLVDLLGRCFQGDMRGLEIIHLDPFTLPGDLDELRRQFGREGETNPIQRMHEATKAENVKCSAWMEEVLAPGQVKFLKFLQILPGGLGPSETNVSSVYLLEPQTSGEHQVVLHKVTKPWDVPFNNDFLVYHKHIFSKSGGSISFELQVAFLWITMRVSPLKPVIRSNTLAETKASGQALSTCLQAASSEEQLCT